jgi:hypothetical protein
LRFSSRISRAVSTCSLIRARSTVLPRIQQVIVCEDGSGSETTPSAVIRSGTSAPSSSSEVCISTMGDSALIVAVSCCFCWCRVSSSSTMSSTVASSSVSRRAASRSVTSSCSASRESSVFSCPDAELEVVSLRTLLGQFGRRLVLGVARRRFEVLDPLAVGPEVLGELFDLGSERRLPALETGQALFHPVSSDRFSADNRWISASLRSVSTGHDRRS